MTPIELAKYAITDKYDVPDRLVDELITAARADLVAKIEAYKKFILTNTNRELVMRDRFFAAHGDFVDDNNFDFDAGLLVTGDFVDDEKERYALMIASTLNNFVAMEKRLAAAEQVIKMAKEAIHELDYSNSTEVSYAKSNAAIAAIEEWEKK